MNAPVSTLDTRRAKAVEAFRVKGVPHRRVEEWKYSDLHAVSGADKVEQAGAVSWKINELPDGVELFDLSKKKMPDWVKQYLGSLTAANPMDAASLGFANSGFALRVSRGISGDVKIRWSGEGQARALIVLEEAASLTLIEDAAEFSGFQNIGVEIVLAQGSHLTHLRRTPKAAQAIRICEISASVARDATYRGHFADFGSKLSRTELHIALDGEGAQTHLSGVGVLNDSHADVTTHVVHASGKTPSTQLFKYVAGGHARGVYQGKVTVAAGANGSDSRQTAKGLLLEDRAEIDLKPELEILADDVKCAHGAAVGDLDPESLFYLRSRGIPEAEARALLMRAFVGDAVEQIENETVRASIWLAVDAALEGLS